MHQNLKIGTKLFLSFVIVAGAAILATGYFSYRAMQKSTEAQVKASLALMAQIEEGSLLQFLDGIQNRAIDFSADRFILGEASAIKNEGKPANELNSYLLETKQPLDDTIIGINIIDMEGKIIASTTPGIIGTDLSERAYFQGASGMEFGTAFLNDVFYPWLFNEDVAAFAAAAPLTDTASGETIGVISNYFALKELKGILTGNRIHDLGTYQDINGRELPHFYLINSAGSMITGTDFVQERPLQKQITIPPVRNCLQKNESMRGQYADHRGVPVVGASVCMENGWVLLAEFDEQYAFLGLKKIGYNILLVTLFTMLFIIGFAYFIAQQIKNPLDALSKMSKRISAGDFSQKVTVSTQDEVGTLGGFMNEMSDRLKKMYDTMGTRIHEQESDLKKFQLAVEHSSDHIIITDNEGVIIYANPAVERITGYTISEVIGEKAGGRNLWGGQMTAEEYETFWHTIKQEKTTFHGEFVNKRKDGTPYHAEVKVDPVIDDDGEIIYFVGIERDITEAKELEQMRNDFIAIVSHQLRTPIGSLRWILEMLLEEEMGKLDKPVKTSIEQAYRSTKHMLQLVQSLLSVSRIDRGNFHKEAELTDITEMVEQAVNEIDLFAGEKKINVSLTIDQSCEAGGCKAKVHPTMFQEILENLLSNAIKYNYPGGDIHLTMSKKDNHVLLEIKDNGIGIPKADHEKVFWKFYRSENAQLHETNGTGIGLFVVKSHLESWGGSIEFESEEGNGTTFNILLPLNGDHAPE